MGFFEILAQIDRKIWQLKQARALLEGSPFPRPSRMSPRKRRPRTHRRSGEAALGDSKEITITKVADGGVTENRPATHLAYQPPQF